MPNSSELPAASPLIELSGVAMERPGRMVLSDVNLRINQGDFLAVTGPNGGGKTTLLRIILRLLAPTAGTVTYSPQLTSVGYLPQKNRIDAMFPISVTDVIASGLLTVKDISAAERRSRVAETLELVELTSHARHAIGEISGGQLQRALLGRAIISRPDLLVMDEPLNFIDKHFEERTYQILQRMAERSTIVLVSHEITEIASMATRHIIVDGSVHECHSAHHWLRISQCD